MRAPLTSIIALIESRQNTSAPHDELTMRERVLHQTKRALTQAESDAWGTQEVDLREITTEAIDDAWVFMNQRRVRIVYCEDEERAWVRGSSWLLLRVISNLINNAIKFSHELGEVRVDVLREDLCWKGVRDGLWYRDPVTRPSQTVSAISA
ncbi:hypothetical protein RM96_20735 [Cupriavidus sp. IDO]|nr:hypothetical protein RM96_20735 [Cupriavidus sp. IDO]